MWLLKARAEGAEELAVRRLRVAGLDSLVVSVDGTSAEAYADVRSGADLELVQHNIGLLRAARDASPGHNPQIGIECVVLRRNVKELPRLRGLALWLGASFVLLTNVLPCTQEIEDEILYGNSAGRSYSSVRSKWSPETLLPRVDIREESFEPMLRLLRFSMIPSTGQDRFEVRGGYCRLVNEGFLAVAWDGEAGPCVALMHSYPCYIMGRRKWIRCYSVGNVGSEAVAHIWRSAEFVRFRDLVRRFDFSPCSDCGGCDLSETNEEDCFGNTFPVCGDCLWARGVIQRP